MKKITLLASFIVLVSCVPQSFQTSTNTPASASIEEMEIPNLDTEPPLIPSVTHVAPILTKDSLHLLEYHHDDWELLFDRDMVVQIGITPTKQIWVLLSSGDIGFFSDGDWVIFSEKDHPFLGGLADMAVAQDGSVWTIGQETLARFLENEWKTFALPNTEEPNWRRKIEFDSDGTLWVVLPNDAWQFDGNQWGEVELPYVPRDLLFGTNDALWVSFGWPGGVGKYEENFLILYPGTGLWLKGAISQSNVEIATDASGDLFAITNRQNWIAQIDSSGWYVYQIPFSKEYELDEFRMKLFIDSKDAIWMNACLDGYQNACLEYYQDDQWVSFYNLPFASVTDILELADGKMLIGTNKGLYQYAPSE